MNTALKNGDSPNQLDAHGQAPLHVIVTKSFRNENTFPIIITLLTHKADINLRNKQGLTAIQVALQSGWQDTAAFLFEHGATFTAATRKETQIRCPDCLKVVATWEAADFNAAKIAPYSYANSTYNHHATKNAHLHAGKQHANPGDAIEEAKAASAASSSS